MKAARVAQPALPLGDFQPDHQKVAGGTMAPNRSCILLWVGIAAYIFTADEACPDTAYRQVQLSHTASNASSLDAGLDGSTCIVLASVTTLESWSYSCKVAARCMSSEDCYARSQRGLGSSKHCPSCIAMPDSYEAHRQKPFCHADLVSVHRVVWACDLPGRICQLGQTGLKLTTTIGVPL